MHLYACGIYKGSLKRLHACRHVSWDYLAMGVPTTGYAELSLTLFKAGGGGIRPDLYFFDRSTLKDCKKWGSWGM